MEGERGEKFHISFKNALCVVRQVKQLPKDYNYAI